MKWIPHSNCKAVSIASFIRTRNSNELTSKNLVENLGRNNRASNHNAAILGQHTISTSIEVDGRTLCIHGSRVTQVKQLIVKCICTHCNRLTKITNFVSSLHDICCCQIASKKRTHIQFKTSCIVTIDDGTAEVKLQLFTIYLKFILLIYLKLTNVIITLADCRVVFMQRMMPLSAYWRSYVLFWFQ